MNVFEHFFLSNVVPVIGYTLLTEIRNHPISNGDAVLICFSLTWCSASKAVDILEAYEGTLDDNHPPENERCEHGEMLLYKVSYHIYKCI